MRKLFLEIRDKDALRVLKIIVNELEKNVNEETMEAEAYGIKVKVKKYGGFRIPIKTVVENLIKNYLHSQVMKEIEAKERLKKLTEDRIEKANEAIKRAKEIVDDDL